jgi:hypothetical protein
LRTIACALFVCLLAISFLAGPSQACPPDEPGPRQTSPIILDLNRNGIALTSINEGTYFDLDVSGVAEACAWTREYTDDAFLAFDDGGDGEIRDGEELFGDHTPSIYNGFTALASLDSRRNGGNADGKIDAQDARYSQLKLWYDLNHDGEVDLGILLTPEQAAAVGQPFLGMMNELQPLSSRVKSISLAHTEYEGFDTYGNWFRFHSTAVLQVGTWPTNQFDVWDVYLNVGN